MPSVAQSLHAAVRRLDAVSDTARLDAEVLLAHALGKDRTWLFTWPDKPLTESQQAQFDGLVGRRAAGEPVAYLLGYREFFGHRFMVSPATLIPRPDTELLVETMLAELNGQAPLTVADLGTGTGAIAISLALACPQWQLIAVDLTRDIVDLAARNCAALGATNVSLRQGNWLAPVAERLDAVVANPPYIRADDPHLLLGDVRFEPSSALVAGEDGLDDLRVIAAQSLEKLNPGGLLLVEHGYDQGEAVRALFSAAGFQQPRTLADLGGNDRVTLARMPDHAG